MLWQVLALCRSTTNRYCSRTSLQSRHHATSNPCLMPKKGTQTSRLWDAFEIAYTLFPWVPMHLYFFKVRCQHPCELADSIWKYRGLNIAILSAKNIFIADMDSLFALAKCGYPGCNSHPTFCRTWIDSKGGS